MNVYTVYTVVVFFGAAESVAMSEAYRESFPTPAIAAHFARRLVALAGDVHCVSVFSGRPSCPLAELLVEFVSEARRRFLASLASLTDVTSGQS